MNDSADLPWGLRVETPPGVQLAFAGVTGALEIALSNHGDRPVRPGRVSASFTVGRSAAGGWAWLQGRFMQNNALVRNFGSPQPDGYEPGIVRNERGRASYRSREMIVVGLPVQAAPCLLIGSLVMDRFFLDIDVVLDTDEREVQEIRVTWDLEDTEVGPAETIALPPALVLEGTDAGALVREYAEEVGRRAGARVPGHVPTGWCSWYQFYNRVSEDDIVRNLEEMRSSGHPAEYVQVDDGFQSATGDWLIPNARFPGGMAALARRIREAGYRPGLWLAPLVLHEGSVALNEHPEFALKTASGDILFVDTWLGRCAVLDATHPGARAWLQHVVRTAVADWGYEYLKLDALAFAAQPATEVRYHTSGTTAPSHLRSALVAIREAAGDDTFILGCTCHFGPAVGLVDAMRVGPDVKAEWGSGPEPSVRHAMRMALQRNWMHRRWWANDPDCLVARDTDTKLTDAEVRFLATGIVLSGGMVVASDDLARVSEARRTLAMALFPPVGIAASPVVASEGPVPAAWRTDLGAGRWLVGVLNWEDRPRWVIVAELLRPGEVAFDVWNGHVLGKGDVLLGPHDGALWQVSSPGPTPRCVGDTGNVGFDGLYQRPVSGRLQLRNDSHRARVVGVEARGHVFEVELSPGEMRWFD